MKKVLITGFTPFAGEKINPSYEAVKQLADEILGFEIIKKEIETSFDSSIEQLDSYIEKNSPSIVILVGQAGGAKNIRVERVAINIDDAPIKDNSGNQPEDKLIKEDGENAYFATLPLKKIVNALMDDGIPAVISNTSGTYVCNHLMYTLLYTLHKKNMNIPAGFIHVPYIFSQIEDKPDTYATDLYAITRALDIAIKTTIKEII
ncbi:pyroglutamyl-peptidase I [Tenericutes bacterium MO-XQ]|nr:pyroglutamyl-peptidase I [Tenericutes bacterium MO-XQ]